MRYTVDWVQFTAALVALVAYGTTIWACFAFYIPWPVTVPLMALTITAFSVWSHRRDVHERGRK